MIHLTCCNVMCCVDVWRGCVVLVLACAVCARAGPRALTADRQPVPDRCVSRVCLKSNVVSSVILITAIQT